MIPSWYHPAALGCSRADGAGEGRRRLFLCLPPRRGRRRRSRGPEGPSLVRELREWRYGDGGDGRGVWGAIMAAALRGRARARAHVAMGTASGPERGLEREPGPHLCCRCCPAANGHSRGDPPGALGEAVRVGRGRCGKSGQEFPGWGEQRGAAGPGPGRSQGEAGG